MAGVYVPLGQDWLMSVVLDTVFSVVLSRPKRRNAEFDKDISNANSIDRLNAISLHVVLCYCTDDEDDGKKTG